MAKFKFQETLLGKITQTARIHDTQTDALTDKDVGKFLKLTGDSQYGLCADGDAIEATLEVHASPAGTYDGYVLGTVGKGGRRRVTFGETLNVGDFVVAGAPEPRGTALTGFPKVKKETAANAFRWRVVSLDGTNAAGQTGVIECVTGAGTGAIAA